MPKRAAGERVSDDPGRGKRMRMSRRYGDMTWESADAPPGGSASGVGLASMRPRSARHANRHAHTLPAASFPSVRLYGVRLHAITEQQAIKHIQDELDAGRGGAVVTPNLDHLRRCTRDLSFNALVAEADLVVA